MFPKPALKTPSPALFIHLPLACPALYIPLPIKRSPNKLAPNVPNNALRNPPFNNKPESSRDFIILIISLISSFDIISVAFPDLNIFLCIPASAADAAAVHPKGIKTLLANGLITFFINGNPVFSNGPSNLPKNPPDCIILDN